jgi:Na+-transporting NADH:ubiquinone oxidoreductase subunit D
MAKDLLTEPLINDNPVTTQLLGICSALAVTTKLETSVVMTISLTAVLTCSNVIISAMRNIIPGKIRMIVELIVIASLVIITDQILKAFAFQISKQLSVFVGLIITNCIVMGRAEAFALANPPKASLLDGIGNGLGYGVILVIVGAIRELLGSGTLYDIKIVPDFMYDDWGYTNMGLMVLAPGAFFLIGLIAAVQKAILLKKGAN